MRVRHLWLSDVRSYEALEVELTPGVCAVVGPNGVGKSNLLEAIAYLALLESFRGAPTDALIRRGASSGVIRGEVDSDGRTQLIEAEIASTGRNRVLLNRQRLGRTRDLLGALRVTVFAPDDLSLVKGGPSLRRSYLDRSLVAVDPRNDAVRSELERALRQRNALLKQTKGRLDQAAELTLEVWDSKLVETGERLAELRSTLVSELSPLVSAAYRDLSGRDDVVELAYVAPWREHGLAEALARARSDELRRGLTLVGPHRDELDVQLNAMPSRTHASQGEQRTLALALRLGSHRLVFDRFGTPPVLLLDDVFSELDPERSAALMRSLPTGQTLLSTAGHLPDDVHADQLLSIGSDGRVGT